MPFSFGCLSLWIICTVSPFCTFVCSPGAQLPSKSMVNQSKKQVKLGRCLSLLYSSVKSPAHLSRSRNDEVLGILTLHWHEAKSTQYFAWSRCNEWISDRLNWYFQKLSSRTTRMLPVDSGDSFFSFLFSWLHSGLNFFGYCLESQRCPFTDSLTCVKQWKGAPGAVNDH